MRIGIEAQRIFRTHKHGMDFVALEMIRRLQKIDQENEYVIFVNEGPDRDCLQETQNFKIIEFKGIYPVWEQLMLPRKARKYGVEILHCTSNTAPVYCSVPLVVTIHDIIYLEKFPLTMSGYSTYQKFGNLYRRAIVKKILDKARMIITVSHFEKKRFHEVLGLKEDRLKVIYNGVGEHFRKIEDKEYLQSVKTKYSLPDRFVLFFGNTDPKKNTANTILAFARYCKKYGRSHKMIVGDFSADMVKSILDAEDNAGFFDQFAFTGYIYNQDLPAVINLADIFLYTSRRESFGLPVLEGMASGTPVITSKTSSMPEVGGEAAFYIDPDNIQDITEAIHTVLSDAGLRTKNIAAGLRRAEDFSWDRTAREVLQVYKEIFN